VGAGSTGEGAGGDEGGRERDPARGRGSLLYSAVWYSCRCVAEIGSSYSARSMPPSAMLSKPNAGSIASSCADMAEDPRFRLPSKVRPMPKRSSSSSRRICSSVMGDTGRASVSMASGSSASAPCASSTKLSCALGASTLAKEHNRACFLRMSVLEYPAAELSCRAVDIV